MQANDLLRPELFDDAYSKELYTAFCTNQPIRHLVIDNFLKQDIATAIYTHFPSMEEMNTHYKGINEKKAEHSNFSNLHPSFEQLHEELPSAKITTWLQAV